MIASSVVYLLLVSGIVSVAAWLAETGLVRARLPARGLWLAGMAAAPLLLVWRLLPEEATAVLPAVPAGPVIELPTFATAPEAAVGLGFEELVLLIWVGSSLGLALFLVRAAYRLRAERSRWTASEESGLTVYRSTSRGPAVAGGLRPWIVLPRWIDELPAPQRSLVLLHEEEHVRGRDTLILPAALVLLCLTPWSPFTWWQFRRLRAAVEVDCDRRVLRREPDPRRYGDSLIAVASRVSGPSLGLAAFTERSSTLKRRIVAMTDRPTPWTSLRAILFTLLALVVAVQACGVDSPVMLDERGIGTVDIPAAPGPTATPDANIEASASDSAPPLPEAPETVPPESIRDAPAFTPFTVAPSITNRDEVVAMMVQEYPPLLREAGIGGTVRVFFLINEEGLVEQIRLDESAGHPALDDAALNVAGAYRFSPALNRDQKVPVWVSFPITFQAR